MGDGTDQKKQEEEEDIKHEEDMLLAAVVHLEVEGKELITERQGSEERSEKHAEATLRFKSDRRLCRQIRGSG
jgi:hypothetical protein